MSIQSTGKPSAFVAMGNVVYEEMGSAFEAMHTLYQKEFLLLCLHYTLFLLVPFIIRQFLRTFKLIGKCSWYRDHAPWTISRVAYLVQFACIGITAWSTNDSRAFWFSLHGLRVIGFCVWSNLLFDIIYTYRSPNRNHPIVRIILSALFWSMFPNQDGMTLVLCLLACYIFTRFKPTIGEHLVAQPKQVQKEEVPQQSGWYDMPSPRTPRPHSD